MNKTPASEHKKRLTRELGRVSIEHRAYRVGAANRMTIYRHNGRGARKPGVEQTGARAPPHGIEALARVWAASQGRANRISGASAACCIQVEGAATPLDTEAPVDHFIITCLLNVTHKSLRMQVRQASSDEPDRRDNHELSSDDCIACVALALWLRPQMTFPVRAAAPTHGWQYAQIAWGTNAQGVDTGIELFYKPQLEAVEAVPLGTGSSALASAIAKLGTQGWELVTVIVAGNVEYYFKKPLP